MPSSYRLRFRGVALPDFHPLPLVSKELFEPRKVPRVFLLTYLAPAFLLVIPRASVHHRYLLLRGDVLNGDHHKSMGLRNPVYLTIADGYISPEETDSATRFDSPVRSVCSDGLPIGMGQG